MKSIKSLIVKNVSIPIIDKVISSSPDSTLKGSWLAFQIAYGMMTDLYIDESKEFISQVKKQIKIIGDELINSKDFQQSLVVTYETLLRTRNIKKREIIKQVFLHGYISNQDRLQFELERYYSVAQEISLPALSYLVFIRDTIIPLKLEWARGEVEKMNKENREGNDEWWIQLNLKRKPESEIITDYYSREFNPNSKKVQAEVPNVLEDSELRKKQFEIENTRLDQYTELSSELVTLGIMRTTVTGGGLIGGGAGQVLKITEFGNKFMDYVSILPYETDKNAL